MEVNIFFFQNLQSYAFKIGAKAKCDTSYFYGEKYESASRRKHFIFHSQLHHSIELGIIYSLPISSFSRRVLKKSTRFNWFNAISIHDTLVRT